MDRGQYLTKDDKLQSVVQELIQNRQTLFEPSAGRGHLLNLIEDLFDKVKAFEVDEKLVERSICDTDIRVDNFLSTDITENFSTIVGNPPYVKISNIPPDDVFDKGGYLNYPLNANLYFYFIEKCVELLEKGGELIFICPKDFFWNESAFELRRFLFKSGSFSHYVVCEDNSYFDGADLESLIIFRYVKSKQDREVKYYENPTNYLEEEFQKCYFNYYNRRLFNISDEIKKYDNNPNFSDLFDIHIGNIITGKDDIFKINGEFESYSREIITTKKKTETFLCLENVQNFEEIESNRLKNYLKKKKTDLINRGIKDFDENNWWKWGVVKNVDNTTSDKGRLLLLCKTRKKKRCWIDKSNNLVSAGLLVLVPKSKSLNLNQFKEFINSDNFLSLLEDFQMKTNDKIRLTTKNLRRLPVPFKENKTKFFEWD